MMARICIPTGPGNRAIADGRLAQLMQDAAERWKPEAMYFTTFDARRTAYVIFDLPDASDIPPFAEPFFHGLDAAVEIVPVMNTEDLQRGLSQLG
jgi:hypothetical protein